MGSDGARLWNRSMSSFEDDWDIIRGGGVREIPIGYDALDPASALSERTYAVGALTEAATEYVVIGHSASFWQSNSLGGRGVKHASFVTVLEPDSGQTMWFRRFPGIVTQVAIVDGVLVVGNETGPPGTAPRNVGGLGEDGTTSTLTGLTFSSATDSALSAQDAWTYATGAEWARWQTIEPAGPGTFATAWSLREPVAGSSELGHVSLVDAQTGVSNWTVTTDSHPRMLRYDPADDEIVIVEQTDPSAGWSYQVEALRASDGSSAGSSITRSAAVPFALEVGDVDGQIGAEWVTSEITMSLSTPQGEPVDANVTAVDPASGSTLWRTVVGDDPPPSAAVGFEPIVPHPAGLTLHGQGDATVVLAATYFTGTEAQPLKRAYSGQSELTAIGGATGSQLWERQGDVLAPLALERYSTGGQPAVLTATGRLVVNMYSLADGSTLASVPLLADVTAVETTDVNGDDVIDLVVGGQSEAVFALDGSTLGENPTILWSTPVAGEVHEIHAVTVQGEQRLVVAAATDSVVDGNQAFPMPTRSAIDVLAADSGTRHFRIPTLPDYAWTVAIARTAPDAIPTIVVPTSSLTAYRASDGVQLWKFPAASPDLPPQALPATYFSNAAVTENGDVAAQYFVNVGINAASQRIRPMSGNSNNHFRVLLDGATGLPRWQVPVATPGLVGLRRSVTVVAETAAGTPGVAFTHGVGQHPTHRTQVEVHDLSDGELSYSSLLARGSSMGTIVLPVNGLVSFSRFSDVADISPTETVERNLRWPASHDITEAHTDRFGDVLVSSAEGHGWIGIYESVPVGTGYKRVADWVGGVTGGSLLARDLDGDGSDEIVHYSHDNNAYVAVTTQVGLFSIGGDGGTGSSGIDIYSFGCSPDLGSPCATPSPSVTPTASPLPDISDVAFAPDSPTSGQYSDDATFAALLTDSDGEPIADAPLTFGLSREDSGRSFEATTDSEGIASVNVTLTEMPGSYDLTVRYDGDSAHAADSAVMFLHVTREDTDIDLKVKGQGTGMRLEARLSDRDAPSSGIGGRTIEFYSDSELIGSARTDEQGIAALDIPPGHRGTNRNYEAVFPGDEFYVASSQGGSRSSGNQARIPV
jgi:hypothetical protein